MTMKLVRDDERAKEGLASATGGADREPEGPALQRPGRRERKRDLAELAGRIRLLDGCGRRVLRRTRFGSGDAGVQVGSERLGHRR